MTTQLERTHMKSLMDLLLAHEPQCNYPRHDIRGLKDAATFRLTEPGLRSKLKLGGHIMFDCSQAVTQICKWAGLDDPNGLGVSRGPGYTGTLLAHLPHYKLAKNALIGALVVYGPSTGEHVSMVYTPGSNPLLFSHGYDGGPVLIRLSAQRQFHRSPVTFLNISRL